MIIDTHCHLLSDCYENPDEEIKKAFSSGVDKLIINGYDVPTSKQAVYLASKYENVYAAVGIAPSCVDSFNLEDVKKIADLSLRDKVVAIGEIGLDYYWTKDNESKQKKVFEEMLKLAKKRSLPVIVHNRKATNDVYDTLKRYQVTGIMHCFSGSLQTANEFIKLGFLIGVGGVVTFKNAKKLKDVVKDVSLDFISLETDSPYLAPEPFRGKVNNPSNLSYIIDEIARIKHINAQEVTSKTAKAVMTKFDL